MPKRSYRGREIAENLKLSNDEDAPLWRREMKEKNASIRWERTDSESRVVSIRVWGYLDGSPRYTISSVANNVKHKSSMIRVERVQLMYWPMRELDQRELLGIFDTVEKAKAAAEEDHKVRKIR